MVRLETLIELKFTKVYLFEVRLLLKLDKQFSIEQFEATASQSTVPSPLLTLDAANALGGSSKTDMPTYDS